MTKDQNTLIEQSLQLFTDTFVTKFDKTRLPRTSSFRAGFKGRQGRRLPRAPGLRGPPNTKTRRPQFLKHRLNIVLTSKKEESQYTIHRSRYASPICTSHVTFSLYIGGYILFITLHTRMQPYIL